MGPGSSRKAAARIPSFLVVLSVVKGFAGR